MTSDPQDPGGFPQEEVQPTDATTGAGSGGPRRRHHVASIAIPQSLGIAELAGPAGRAGRPSSWPTLNAIANVGFITVFPLWTLLIVGLDLIVIYQLTARWLPAGTTYSEGYEPQEGGATAARDEMTRIRTGL